MPALEMVRGEGRPPDLARLLGGSSSSSESRVIQSGEEEERREAGCSSSLSRERVSVILLLPLGLGAVCTLRWSGIWGRVSKWSLESQDTLGGRGSQVPSLCSTISCSSAGSRGLEMSSVKKPSTRRFSMRAGLLHTGHIHLGGKG